MRRILLCFFLIFAGTATFATVIVVQVSNFKFAPKTFNAVVGDTIRFSWKNGIHNTTSTKVPRGAATWAALSDSAHLTFNYVLTVPGTYKFVCTIHAPGMKGTINVTPTLASGLSGFSVDELNNQAVINWNTKSESDVSYYSVQRSTDGDNFSEVARLRPTTTDTKSHSFTDKNTGNTSKYVYYQVQIVDKKGNSQLSEIKMATLQIAAAKLITSLSPNPISKPGHLMVQFNSDKEGKMLMQLYTESGRFVKQAEMTADKGLNNGHFHLGDIPAGTYYVICTMGTTKEKYTIMVK
ncbi:MAG TPA: plastocyanin/azurin family copper-binding protein [Panacibacter sp.]|nr:plastocyanin/azurin family copper-binding protein [Panacibacter sp.]